MVNCSHSDLCGISKMNFFPLAIHYLSSNFKSVFLGLIEENNEK